MEPSGPGGPPGPFLLVPRSVSMPLIQVKQTPGKTAEQKAELVRELTDAYTRVTGSTPESVWVTVEEVAPDSWSVGGRTLTARAAAARS
ncbi:4-oxalocrotonate tautomerase family protein [Streptomyces sp. AV19]|uniref:tautomerase family protein n=1 Tax=Streptomyces sp. AV19 TaxID=2793068 RepID=UPI0018FEAD56|nr:4-oxalocrotonate tautomerase family protein [Streptomyces sp. AV19]MBH1933391.1 4-oxalocrotonate tautomerase family protein [Streptomyces sp. AV19]MDG4536143.1 4-oxalocrotonate tautomerase family protein [Streptomyces sp. AV19]